MSDLIQHSILADYDQICVKITAKADFRRYLSI